MKKILVALMFVVLTTMCLPKNVFSASLVDDWSDATNPNGDWSYNQGATPLSTNVLGWPASDFGPTQRAWANGNAIPDLIPAWMKSSVDPGAGFDWLVGDVIAHSTDDFSGGSNGLANVTWTSSISGSLDIAGGVWLGRDGLGRSNDWSLFLNGGLLGSGSVFDGDAFSRASPNTFSFLGVGITPGDILKFELTKTSEFGEFVGVNLTITPEPLSTVLFLIGGVPIAANIYRKRKKLAIAV